MARNRSPEDEDELCWHTTRNIILNVYDIHDSNSWLFGAGLGFYHSGIEISINSEPLGYEYSFSTEGVIKTKPRLAGFGVLRTQIKLGIHKGTYLDIHRVVNQLAGDQFAVGKYDIIACNCNHFTEAFAFTLLKVHIPGWVNRLAYIGSALYSPPQEESKGVDYSDPRIKKLQKRGFVVDEPPQPLMCTWLCGLDLPSVEGISVAESKSSKASTKKSAAAKKSGGSPPADATPSPIPKQKEIIRTLNKSV